MNNVQRVLTGMGLAWMFGCSLPLRHLAQQVS